MEREIKMNGESVDVGALTGERANGERERTDAKQQPGSPPRRATVHPSLAGDPRDIKAGGDLAPVGRR
jgi:hypothetical protein